MSEHLCSRLKLLSIAPLYAMAAMPTASKQYPNPDPSTHTWKRTSRERSERMTKGQKSGGRQAKQAYKLVGGKRQGVDRRALDMTWDEMTLYSTTSSVQMGSVRLVFKLFMFSPVSSCKLVTYSGLTSFTLFRLLKLPSTSGNSDTTYHEIEMNG